MAPRFDAGQGGILDDVILNNVYKTVTIGTQTWMAENLRTTRFSDSTAIPLVKDEARWAGLTSSGYCWYKNDEDAFKPTYGALYNWYTINTGKICPIGWHVPDDSEWTQLTTYLGGDYIAGGKLKETGSTYWVEPNTGATNETGFTALPGGNRRYDGFFSGPAGNGNWRTSSEYDDNQVWYRYIFYHSGYIYRNITNMQAGYSVRCISE